MTNWNWNMALLGMKFFPLKRTKLDFAAIFIFQIITQNSTTNFWPAVPFFSLSLLHKKKKDKRAFVETWIETNGFELFGKKWPSKQNGRSMCLTLYRMMKIKTTDRAMATYVTISNTKTVVGPNLALVTWPGLIKTAKLVKWSHSQVVSVALVFETWHPVSDHPESSKFQNTQMGSVKFGVKCVKVIMAFCGSWMWRPWLIEALTTRELTT